MPLETTTIEEQEMRKKQSKFKKVHATLSDQKSIIIIGSLILLVIIIGLFYWRHERNKEPETFIPSVEERLESLRKLEETSDPVTATEEERMAQLQKLEKSSKIPANKLPSREERLKQLQALEESSRQ